MGTSASWRVVRFGPFEADARSGELRKQGRKIRLQDQPFQILLMLLAHPGELVTREELRERLWPADTFVDFDHGLNNAVNRLREALGDSPEKPRFIETLPKKGYRFIAPVNGHVNTETALGSQESGNGRSADQQVAEAPAASDAGSARLELRIVHEFPEKSLEIVEEAVEKPRRASRYRSWALAAILLAMGIVAYKVFSKPGKSHGPIAVKRLTTSGNVRQAAISPDAKYAAYFQEEKGYVGWGLWLQQVGTPTRTRLLAPDPEMAGEYAGLRFSRDGGYLYFTRVEPNPSTRSLYRISLLGGMPEKLLADVSADFDLSPDAKYVTYISPDPADDRDALVVVPINGGRKKVIAKVPPGDKGFSNPAWSHDGIMLAVVEHVAGAKLNHLLVVPLDGGPGRRITSDQFCGIGEPEWLPDDSGLVAMAFGHWLVSNEQFEYEAGFPQLWEFPYPTGSARRITNDLFRYFDGASVSAHSPVLAAVAQDLVSAIWMGPASDPDQVRPITSLSGHYVANMGLTWTGSGKVVYWTSAGDAFDLIVMDADGGNPRPLPRDLPYQMHPEACSDGYNVVYTGAYPYRRQVMRRDLDGARPQALATGAFPQCSPDSSWVVYYDDIVNGVPLKISMEGGQPVPLMEEECWRAGISPDGKWVACVHETGKLAILPFSGGKPVRLLDLPPTLDQSTAPMRWTPDSQSVVYAVDEGEVDNLWAQPAAGGPRRALTHFTSQKIEYFAFSHDGKQIAIGRGTPSSDVVMISNFR